MTGCCSFPNLGCLQIPTNTTTITGAIGYPADMARASTTSNTLGLGAQTFTYTVTSPNIGWAVGTRLRAYNSSTDYMEGFVTAVSGSSVTFTSDLVVGSGTFASWDIVIAGDQGSAGSAGTPGTTNIISDSTTGVTATLGLTVIKTGVIPANTLVNIGDAINIRVSFNHVNASSFTFDDGFNVSFGGQSFIVGIGGQIPIIAGGVAFVDIRFVKTGTTTATALFSYYGGASGVFNGYAEVNALTALDFTISNNITISSVQAVASRVECTGLYVDLIKA